MKTKKQTEKQSPERIPAVVRRKPDGISDLIYGGYQYIDELKEMFPDMEYEHANSDGIHEGRIEIFTHETDEIEYYRKIFLNGFSELSLTFQLKIRDGKDFYDKFIKLIDKWKVEYPAYFA